MEYCNLGNSGLEVARLGLGTIPFGTILDDKACQRFVDTYEDAGGNLVDTSNLYGGGTVGTNTEMAGTAERAVGRALKGKRHRFAVATKGYWLMQDEVRPNSVGLSRTYSVNANRGESAPAGHRLHRSLPVPQLGPLHPG